MAPIFGLLIALVAAEFVVVWLLDCRDALRAEVARLTWERDRAVQQLRELACGDNQTTAAMFDTRDGAGQSRINPFVWEG